MTRRKAQREPVWIETQDALARWYETALGDQVLDALEGRLSTSLSDVFGYQGLQIGNPAPGRNLLDHAGVQKRIVLDAPGRPADLCGDALQLPVAHDTMKVVMFFHTLDFCHLPHQAMREADRVLMNDGQLIVVGFNPMSLFGARHVATGWRRRVPWHGQFYSRWRVGDWLSVLDYQVLHSEALFVRPPINSARLLARFQRLERLQPWLGAFGGLYVLKARKQTVPMTLARRHWRPTRARIAVGSFARTGEQASQRREHEKKDH